MSIDANAGRGYPADVGFPPGDTVSAERPTEGAWWGVALPSTAGIGYEAGAAVLLS